MYITRLRVENEGFLAGLDVDFAPGLNVVIGARGTGKTSLIELIRFCLQSGSFTEKAAQRGHQQALAILAGGAVTVDLYDPVNQASFTVTRSASGHTTSTLPTTAAATVLAQNEVEAVGAQAAGRLHLVDRLRPAHALDHQQADALSMRLRSLTQEAQDVLGEVQELTSRLAASEQTNEQLEQARRQQMALLESAKASREDRERLEQYQTMAGLLANHSARVVQAESDLADLESAVSRAQSLAQDLMRSWAAEPSGTAPVFTSALSMVSEAASSLEQALSGVRRAIETLLKDRSDVSTNQASLERATRELRQKLSTLQEGVGAATRRVDELEEAAGQLSAMRRRLDDRWDRYRTIASERESVYRTLDEIRTKTFNERQLIAASLTQQLAPHVRVSVERSASREAYVSAIVAGLRGSGLHYNNLAPQIASRVSPFELATWVERADTSALSQALNIAPDRCLTLIGALRSSGVGDIIAAHVEDRVSLELLDGRDYKPSDRLSIGQRCTVILPVLFGSHGDPLIIDQPEDHLDNAFIANTLVKSLRNRVPTDQYILTSHNPNIPVLGEADQVVAMESDGQRGYVRVHGPLDDPDVVSAISSIMEGGAEAFARRAQFYGGSR